MSQRWLVIRLQAPLMAFGGVAVDQVGPTRDFPAASMLTGLFANALGLHWSDRMAHQALQDRLIFAARREREAQASAVLTDMQNAQLSKADKGWTTFGVPSGRDGASYGAPHRTCPGLSDRSSSAGGAAARSGWRPPHSGDAGRSARLPGPTAVHRA